MCYTLARWRRQLRCLEMRTNKSWYVGLCVCESVGLCPPCDLSEQFVIRNDKFVLELAFLVEQTVTVCLCIVCRSVFFFSCVVLGRRPCTPCPSLPIVSLTCCCVVLGVRVSTSVRVRFTFKGMYG